MPRRERTTPGISALLAKYRQNGQYPKLHCANPQWSSAIGIGCWQEGRVPGAWCSHSRLQAMNSPRLRYLPHVRIPCVSVLPAQQMWHAAFERETREVFELFRVIKDALAGLG